MMSCWGGRVNLVVICRRVLCVNGCLSDCVVRVCMILVVFFWYFFFVLSYYVVSVVLVMVVVLEGRLLLVWLGDDVMFCVDSSGLCLLLFVIVWLRMFCVVVVYCIFLVVSVSVNSLFVSRVRLVIVVMVVEVCFLRDVCISILLELWFVCSMVFVVVMVVLI